MDMFIDSGLGAYVGKVNMDQNTAPYLTEKTEESIKNTEDIILKYKEKSNLVKPIITPRFVPTCSGPLLEGLGNLAKKHGVPVQSHLNENTSEIIWVSELFPESPNYASVYNDYGLFGQSMTIMGHCVYNNQDEMELMAKNKVYVAHCPYSNLNLSSGMMKTRKYLDMNIPVGLGSDISGGHSLNMTSIITAAIEMSKMVWLESEKQLSPLTLSEAFYLATKGGGSLFGKVGSFEEGYEFDALIIDDSSLVFGRDFTLNERLQKYIYIGDDRNIMERYVSGIQIKEPQKLEF
jgi:guanine deaminase